MKSLLIEDNGQPLAVAISGANTPDAQLLKATLEAIVVERPTPAEQEPQHLCLDTGYDNAPASRGNRDGGGLLASHPACRRGKLDTEQQKTHPVRVGW